MMLRGVIFDMDGTLIHTNEYWKSAEKEVFSSVGVEVCEQLSRHTESMTTKGTTEFWYSRFPWSGRSKAEVEQSVIQRVIQNIELQGQAVGGAREALAFFKNRGLRLALASNSPMPVISAVLSRLQFWQEFDEVVSADEVDNGKPDPSVFSLAASRLGVRADECLVVEDSESGVLAARRAGMRVLAITTSMRHEAAKRLKVDFKLPRLDLIPYSLSSADLPPRPDPPLTE